MMLKAVRNYCEIERTKSMSKLIALYFIGFMLLGLVTILHASGSQGVPDGTKKQLKTARFAGGCFWCMEPPFDKLEGVISTTVGYCGGREVNPTYKQVSSGETGHAEAIEITYDPDLISYSELLDVFWRSIDPTQKNGQFADIGPQYRTAIFYHDEEQKRLAEVSKADMAKSGRFNKEIVTEIVPATTFYRAEEYHQDYYKKNPIRYKLYRYGSGRDDYLTRKWGKR
jgi:peptide-methionine (S)-S-oxide reductase